MKNLFLNEKQTVFDALLIGYGSIDAIEDIIMNNDDHNSKMLVINQEKVINKEIANYFQKNNPVTY